MADDTQSARTLLRGWMRAEHGRASKLARDLEVSRQTLYNWLEGTSPRAEQCRQIEAVTEGAVPAASWLT